MRPATPDQAARFFTAVMRGRIAPMHAPAAKRIRAALAQLGLYRAEDMTAPAQSYSISMARQLLTLAAAELDAADAAALADAALALLATRSKAPATVGATEALNG